MRVLLQTAVILHRRAYRDTSLLLEIFTPEYGRLGLVARGAATGRTRWKGVLQSFAPLLMSWSGAGELATLTHAEEAGQRLIWPPRRTLAGWYVNELLLRLLPRQDPQPRLFAAYQTLLVELVAAQDEEPPLRRFEHCLLAELGYGLSLERESVSGLPILADENYRYILEQGPVRASHTAIGIPVSGRSLLALRDGVLHSPEVLREIKLLTRAALAQQLHGRALKTRELYRKRGSERERSG